jgi:hypothetical protein
MTTTSSPLDKVIAMADRDTKPGESVPLFGAPMVAAAEDPEEDYSGMPDLVSDEDDSVPFSVSGFTLHPSGSAGNAAVSRVVVYRSGRQTITTSGPRN